MLSGAGSEQANGQAQIRFSLNYEFADKEWAIRIAAADHLAGARFGARRSDIEIAGVHAVSLFRRRYNEWRRAEARVRATQCAALAQVPETFKRTRGAVPPSRPGRYRS